jgi:acyl-CoA dehydrogenase
VRLDLFEGLNAERKVFGRPIGQNQGIAFPLAEAYIELEAASLMRWRACEPIDARQPAGTEANMAKHLAPTMGL